jgi:hypothetical protein
MINDIFVHAPRCKMAKLPIKWRAAVCYDSPSVTKMVRKTLDDLGWKYERDRALHHFSRLIVVLAILHLGA